MSLGDFIERYTKNPNGDIMFDFTPLTPLEKATRLEEAITSQDPKSTPLSTLTDDEIDKLDYVESW